jgi:phospholipase/carboxylesterase
MANLSLSGPGLKPRSGHQPKQLVIFLHGLGADGDDLIGLAPHFAEALPDAEFLSPHAPFPCDMAPFGRQWFSLQQRGPAEMLQGLKTVRPLLDAYLDEMLAKRSLTDNDLALVGFSQGTMLALYAGLRRSAAVAGIVGYSGLLAAPDLLPAEITARPPVLLVHGEQDAVVAFQFMELAKSALELLQVPVTSLSRPGLGHSIDDVGLAAGIRFLADHFAKKQV